MAENSITIKRGNSIQAVAPIDESTIYSNEFMADDKITAVFTLPNKIDVRVRDYIEHNGQRYHIPFELPPEETKTDAGDFVYNITFYGPIYDLYNKIIRDEGAQTFPYTDTPVGFMQLLIENIRSQDIGWTLGEVALIDEPQTLTFDATSCRVALTNIAEAFGLEYYLVGKEINLVEVAGSVKGDKVFKQGINNGLYTLARKGASNGFSTIWIGQGGTKNLPDGYRDNATGGRLSFDGNPVIAQPGYDYFGPREDTVTFEDIYPRFDGIVTAVAKIADNIWRVTCPQIDFNINDIAIKGSTKIVFKSGELGNNEFLITAYDNQAKTIDYTIFQEESGYILPNDVVNAAVGDKFTLVNLYMPASYVTNAENKLSAATQEHALKNGLPKFVYDLTIDEHYVRQIGYENYLFAGDRLPVQDDDFNINADLRIQAISWPLVNPAKITASISEEVQYTVAEKLVKAVISVKAGVKDSTKSGMDALANALFAQQVADDVANSAAYGLFKKTVIALYSILTGAFVAGNPVDGSIAGIDGSAYQPTDTVFWGGASFEDRATAVFRVLLDGTLYASNAIISGEIVAKSGKIGNFDITSEGLRNIENVDAYIDQTRTFPSGKRRRAAIGTNIDFTTLQGFVGIFESTEATGNPNGGLRISVKNGVRGPLQGAFSGNTALDIEGDFVISDGNMVVDTGGKTFASGWTGSFTYDRDGDVGRITVVKGIITKQEKI